ncbi:hypothetical protein C8Q78DRAFT_682122 [Trametes maxima]|nr:hypothetical protein C8Q78DRAFT_682122 [Trametes maxima]
MQHYVSHAPATVGDPRSRPPAVCAGCLLAVTHIASITAGPGRYDWGRFVTRTGPTRPRLSSNLVIGRRAGRGVYSSERGRFADLGHVFPIGRTQSHPHLPCLSPCRKGARDLSLAIVIGHRQAPSAIVLPLPLSIPPTTRTASSFLTRQEDKDQ